MFGGLGDNKMASLQAQRLSRDDPTAVADLQSVFNGAPAFSLLVEGKLPEPDAAEQALEALPPDIDYPDKFVFGYYLDQQIAGCADVIRGYPEKHCAFIGLLLFAENWQRQGLGKQALQHIDHLARGWGCQEIRLGVVANNQPGLVFWTAQGFVEQSRRELPGYPADLILMSRSL